MSAAPLRRGRREPPPVAGTVELRLQGRTEDNAVVLLALHAAAAGEGLRIWLKPGIYPDRNGETVRQYVRVDLREKPPE